MKGYADLMNLRRSGMKPAFVWVNDMPNCAMDGLTVNTFGETPELMDFRFLVGVTAIVEGEDAARVERIAKVCEPIAKRVIASVFAPINKFRCEISKITDTDGVMVWPN